MTFSQEHRGRPGAATRYRRREKTVFHVQAGVIGDAVAYDARTDGLFSPHHQRQGDDPGRGPRAGYHCQPNPERRHHVLKGPEKVAPVYLQAPHRIEALLTCHFFAQLVEAFIEREIESAMRAAGPPTSRSI